MEKNSRNLYSECSETIQLSRWLSGSYLVVLEPYKKLGQNNQLIRYHIMIIWQILTCFNQSQKKKKPSPRYIYYTISRNNYTCGTAMCAVSLLSLSTISFRKVTIERKKPESLLQDFLVMNCKCTIGTTAQPHIARPRGKSLLESFLPCVQPPLIFVRFISNFLCMCSNSMASAHVILK